MNNQFNNCNFKNCNLQFNENEQKKDYVFYAVEILSFVGLVLLIPFQLIAHGGKAVSVIRQSRLPKQDEKLLPEYVDFEEIGSELNQKETIKIQK
jgi:regulator of PEP synthase PpsR (kinase-PPPase family)